MLDFGVEKVIWVLTTIKKIMVAVPNQSWQTHSWAGNIEILDGIISILRITSKRTA
jgi:hypothetical protein